MMRDNMRTVHVKIIGRVQGVWFRDSTVKEAEKIGVTGWVRNTSDGFVEAVFQGEDEKVLDLIDWCHKGSPMSIVEQVDVQEINSDEYYESFDIRY